MHLKYVAQHFELLAQKAAIVQNHNIRQMDTQSILDALIGQLGGVHCKECSKTRFFKPKLSKIRHIIPAPLNLGVE